MKPSMALGVLSVLLGVVGACSIEPTYVGKLEVWNRTETAIAVVGRNENLDVPACGHAEATKFVLNRYDIVDDLGRFIARHGGGGSDPSRVDPAYEMVTNEGAIYSDSKPPAEPLPACDGTVRGQETGDPPS